MLSTANDRALVVEDVVTTGLSIGETISVVRARGAAIVGLGVIVSRAPTIAALRAFAHDDGLPVNVLLDLPLESYDESECPMCRSGAPIADPGSRRS